MRKAVIAVPPVRDFYFTPRRASALGARSLGRELEKNGWETILLNLPLMGRNRTIPLPEELGYLKSFIIPGETGPLSWFSSYRHFGPSFADAAQIIAEKKPDALFISSFAWAYAEEARNLAEETARVLPGMPIIIGGHGPSSLPEYFLEAAHPKIPGKPLFSRVVAGEIEGHGALAAEMDGKGRFLDLRKSDLKEDLLPIAGESMLRAGRGSLSITLTRGCPKKCRFCSNHICHGRIFRTSPPELWEKEVIRAAEEGGIDAGRIQLNIEDDNILFLKDDFFHFLENLKSRFPGISYTAENGLDYMLLEDEDIQRLKTLGFSHLNLSLAVLSGEKTSKEKREGNPEKLARLIQRCNEVKLPVTTHFISGLEGDSREDIVSTLKFLDALPTESGISNFYPVPGLEGYTDMGLFLEKPPRLALGSSVYPWNKSMSSAQMISAFRLSRWSNFRKKYENEGRSGASDSTAIQEKLYRRIIRSRRLYTITRGGDILPIPRLDEDMVEDFFS